jgi:hypothetical protein
LEARGRVIKFREENHELITGQLIYGSGKSIKTLKDVGLNELLNLKYIFTHSLTLNNECY